MQKSANTRHAQNYMLQEAKQPRISLKTPRWGKQNSFEDGGAAADTQLSFVT